MEIITLKSEGETLDASNPIHKKAIDAGWTRECIYYKRPDGCLRTFIVLDKVTPLNKEIMQKRNLKLPVLYAGLEKDGMAVEEYYDIIECSMPAVAAFLKRHGEKFNTIVVVS